MIRRPPRSTLDRSSAASDVYKRQTLGNTITTATGYVLAKVDAAGNETVIERLVVCNNSNNFYAGDGNPGGGTVAAATTFAFAAGSILSKRMAGTASHFIAQGEIIRMRGST